MFIVYSSNPQKIIKAVELWCKCGGESTIRDIYSARKSDRYLCRKCRYGTLEVECDYCGDNFLRSPNKIKRSKTGFHFCSRDCKDSAQSIKGLRDFAPSHYGTGNRYRRQALDYYEEVCNMCGETRNYVLIVHHKDGNRSNGDISNLEVLCRNCHCVRHLKTDAKGKLIYCGSALTTDEIYNKINNLDMV